jgi:hypothetical protein
MKTTLDVGDALLAETRAVSGGRSARMCDQVLGASDSILALAGLPHEQLAGDCLGIV